MSQINLPDHPLRDDATSININQIDLSFCEFNFSDIKHLQSINQQFSFNVDSNEINKSTELDRLEQVKSASLKDQQTNVKVFNCDECSANFKEKKYLNRHKRNDHNKNDKTLNVDCLDCETKLCSRTKLIDHLNQVHCENILIHKKEFKNVNDFESFKLNLEKRTMCKFVKNRGKDDRTNVTVFECNRSGAKRQVDENQRKYDLSFKESCKTGRCCTAYIKLELSEGKC